MDVPRAAKLLIDHHGEEALIHAATRADQLLHAGDLDGAAVWRRIIRTIKKRQLGEQLFRAAQVLG